MHIKTHYEIVYEALMSNEKMFESRWVFFSFFLNDMT